MRQFEKPLPNVLGFARNFGAKAQNETQPLLAREQIPRLNPTYKKVILRFYAVCLKFTGVEPTGTPAVLNR